METLNSLPDIRLSGNVSRTVTGPLFTLAGYWPEAMKLRKSSRLMGRVSLAVVVLLGGLMMMTGGCANSSGISNPGSGVPDRPRYTSREGFMRKQKILDLAVGRRHLAQERLEFKWQQADRRAIRWEKLQRMLAAARTGRKETL